MRLTLKEVFFREKAKGSAEARAGGLALYIGKSRKHSGAKVYILFDAAQAEKDMRDEGNFDIWGFSVHTIKAFIEVEHPNTYYGGAYGAKEVKLSAAVDKYGPMLYDIVMGAEGGLTSDRDSVSRSAKKVWNYYDKNRPDVKKKQLDNYAKPKTKTKKDDSEWQSPETAKNPLNKAYFQRPKSTGTLEANYKKFVANASRKINKRDILEKLEVAASDFFDANYA